MRSIKNHYKSMVTKTRKASALKNVPEYDKSSQQKMSSYDKKLCGVKSTYFKKSQHKYKVDVVNDCSDNKKTRLTLITKEPLNDTT
eukprot:2845992-Ditylum_brightwellii.AAC.1